MDNVVVDGSVAVKWVVTELHSAEAVRVLNAYNVGKLNILVPDLFYAEVGNIAWKKFRFQGVQAPDAQRIVDEILQMKLVVTASETLLADAYQHAIAHLCSVYDGLYVALSVREKCRFVTADQKLVNALGSKVSNITWLANWP